MKILGYRKFTSKSNIACCIVQCLTEYNDSEKSRGAVGQKVEEVWVPDAFQNLISPAAVGKNLNVSYGIGSDRKAYVTDLSIN